MCIRDRAQGVGCDRRGAATPLDVVTSAYPVTRYWRGLKRSLPGGGVSRKDATYGGPRSPVPAFFGDFDWLALARPECSWDKGLRDPTFVFAQPEALRALRARLGRVAPARRRSSRGATRRLAFDAALLFDCDGVLVETEELHRLAYNEAFAAFGLETAGAPVEWSVAYYDKLQNTVGGGKPKMKYHFTETRGWTNVAPGPTRGRGG